LTLVGVGLSQPTVITTVNMASAINFVAIDSIF